MCREWRRERFFVFVPVSWFVSNTAPDILRVYLRAWIIITTTIIALANINEENLEYKISDISLACEYMRICAPRTYNCVKVNVTLDA